MTEDELLDYIETNLEEFKPHSQWLLVPPEATEIFNLFPDAEASVIFQRPDWKFDQFTAYGWYLCMRLTGEAHRFAEAVVMQQSARGQTDDTFFSGMPMLGDQFRSKVELDRVINAARSQGYNPGPHDVYMPNLAQSKGDPAAFISRSDGRAKIQKVCEARGWDCDGGVTVAGRQGEPAENVALADDLVVEGMRESVAADPTLAKLDRQELRQAVIEKHGMPPAKS